MVLGWWRLTAKEDVPVANAVTSTNQYAESTTRRITTHAKLNARKLSICVVNTLT